MNRIVLKQFLNATMVQRHGILGRYGGYTVVTLYDNLIYKVCPNPFNSKRCDEVEDQYEKGIFAYQQDFTLTKEQFGNPKFWN